MMSRECNTFYCWIHFRRLLILAANNMLYICMWFAFTYSITWLETFFPIVSQQPVHRINVPLPCLTPQFQWTPKMEQPLRIPSHAYDQNENGKHLIWFWFNCRFRFTEIVVRSHSFHLIQWKTFHPWLIAFSSLTFQWVSKYFANDSKGKNGGVEWIVVPN